MPAATPAIRLTNTLTRKKEDFVPLDPGNVRMYVCGPTVYDDAHIGNARPVIVFDLLFRLLRHSYGPTNVTYVRNITDVDDKINARAAERGISIAELTAVTEARFQEDAAALFCLAPTVQPRATDFIGPRPDGRTDMISLIKTLVEKGHAYEADGEVLFRIESMPDYGRLSGRNLADNIAGARVAVEEHKENPADFVLWKRAAPDEPGWDSPWGRGRPGWHIECSAMSAAYLGQTFDIHGGGLDLIFPHHENEIAQSRCAHGTNTMANYWMHNGYLQLEGRKMSKSEGNFVTIRELLTTETFGGRRWPGEVLRLAMLMTHYREPIDFSVARLEEAEAKLIDWQRVAEGADLAAVIAPDESVIAQLADDLNFVRAAAAMDVIARKANRGSASAAACLAATLDFFGFPRSSLLRAGVEDTAPIEAAIARRRAALEAKDFATADGIRAELLEKGIQLLDTRDPETGERRTAWEMKR